MAPQRLARYLLPVGAFLALLYLCSLRLRESRTTGFPGLGVGWGWDPGRLGSLG